MHRQAGLVDGLSMPIFRCPQRDLFSRIGCSFHHTACSPVITYETKIIDRSVGRNADLLAVEVGKMPTAEERYPFIRILISIIEQAHPEWNQAPSKDKQMAHLIFHMSHGGIDREETAHIVRLRDEERGQGNRSRSN